MLWQARDGAGSCQQVSGTPVLDLAFSTLQPSPVELGILLAPESVYIWLTPHLKFQPSPLF